MTTQNGKTMPFDLTFASLDERAIQYDAGNSVADFDAEMRAYAALVAESRAVCPICLIPRNDRA
jgi:hypothetical protein